MSGRSASIEVVVAAFREDLSWLTEFRDVAVVYCKGPPPVRALGLNPCRALPNVGREGHSYLYHIVSQYDDLADVTVFTQGDYRDHAPALPDFVRRMQAGLEGPEDVGGYRPLGDWSIEVRGFDCRHHRGLKPCLESTYRSLFATEPPDVITFHAGAIFAVTRSCVLRRPRDFYRRCLSLLDGSVDPECGYAMERLWGLVFDPAFVTR